MPRITSLNNIDTLTEFKEVKIPMVVVKQERNNKTEYVGFVPGINLKTICFSTLDKCAKELMNEAKSKVKEMINNNTPFPFFPTKEEIMEEYKDACYIKFLNVKK